jgi:hypothetical protein
MNHRHFRRIPFEAEVTLKADEETCTGQLFDVSLKGAMVGTETPLPFNLGAQCSLCIVLPGTPISLNFQAKLVHQEELCYGFKFISENLETLTHLRYGFKFISENLETLTHLRKLIELNTGDAEATRSELGPWLSDL